MQNINAETVQLIIVAAVALTMLIQAIVLLAIFSTVRKAVQGIREDVENLRSSIVPVVDSVRELLVRTTPKVEATAADLSAVAHNLRRQTADVQTAANDIIERVRHQTVRIDEMMTSIFDALDRATWFMTDTVSKPMRQIAGILASAKAIVETLRTDAPAAQAADNEPKGD
jgi:methyl-accepting chemotaxis protein